MPLHIDASQLTAFQQCPRKWLLNQSGEIQRWRPRGLFIAKLRQAIHGLCTDGGKLDAVTAEAVAGVMETAANPGLDTPKPFDTARSLASTLKTVLARVHASSLPPLTKHPTIRLSNTVSWSCCALFDGNGLHAWAAVDSLSDPVLARELHGWAVVGDCGLTGLPMTLHVVEIGRHGSDGRFHSPWCRVFAHPIITHRWAFQQKDGRPLKGKWHTAYFEDGRNDPQEWIELMRRDNVQAYKDVPIQQISVARANQVKEEILIEAERMRAIAEKSWQDEPMRRTACDLPLCNWQSTCYR